MRARPAGLDPRRVPGSAVRALALALLDDALARMADGDARAVHQARRTCKQVRALLRLARPQLGARYAAGNLGLRDAARTLSAGREATVLVDTAKTLFARQAKPRRELVHALRYRAQPDHAADLREARRQVQRERRRIAGWRLAGWRLARLAPRQLARGLQHSHRRARRSYRAALRRPSAPALHEWRKQVKYHRNQLALAAPLWREGRARVRGLDTLGDLLGWHQDLQVLALALDGMPRGTGRLAARARRRIGQEQARAARAALELGTILFAGRSPAWLESRS